jgi:D-cysteine desulfhydrase family pyridoxal phosphate-dependent enzyme
LANLPTPVESLSRLSAALQGPKIFIKRDDLTGAGLGGNKIRKLEYLVAEAQANGAKCLITTGAAQSNHARQTAAVAARLGFQCKLVLSGDPSEREDGNLLIDRLFGAEITWCEITDRSETLQKVFEESWRRGERPYFIPMGGSTPTGSLGYMNAFNELISQNIEVDWIILASSSGGTQAGLELGKSMNAWKGRILGVNVGSEEKDLRGKIWELCTEAWDRIGDTTMADMGEIQINEDYQKAGYGNPTEDELETIRLFARMEGIILDPVYTARAAAAMFDMIRKGLFSTDERILFWHTGGIPAIFSEKYSRLLSG